MFDVNKAIYACDDVICRNIESFTTEQRGLLSQNILSQLRNFVENIFVKVYISLGGEPQRKDYDTIRVACSYVKALQGEYRFLSQFHKLLQISVSHYTLDPDSSERLMLKYYEYLLRIRILMKEKFGMKLLANLSQFPLNTDKTFTLYYKAIAQAIYNPQIQISVVSGTKRSIFRQKNKTKRSKKKAAHNTYKAGAKG